MHLTPLNFPIYPIPECLYRNRFPENESCKELLCMLCIRTCPRDVFVHQLLLPSSVDKLYNNNNNWNRWKQPAGEYSPEKFKSMVSLSS